MHKLGSLKLARWLPPVTDIESITITLNGILTFRNMQEECILQPATMTLRIIRSNRVVALDLSLRTCNETEAGNAFVAGPNVQNLAHVGSQDSERLRSQFVVTADDSFDVVISTRTEDGQSFVPVPNSFEVSVKHCGYTASSEPFESPFLPNSYEFRGRSVDSDFFPAVTTDQSQAQALYCRHVSSESHALKAGLYEITVSYTEKREGSMYANSGNKKVNLYECLFDRDVKAFHFLGSWGFICFMSPWAAKKGSTLRYITATPHPCCLR